jgi:hypothetical protein
MHSPNGDGINGNVYIDDADTVLHLTLLKYITDKGVLVYSKDYDNVK